MNIRGYEFNLLTWGADIAAMALISAALYLIWGINVAIAAALLWAALTVVHITYQINEL